MSMKQVNFLHMLVGGPLLYYYGDIMDNIEDKYIGMLQLLFIIIPFIVRLPNLNNMRRSDWINAAHWFLFLPFGLYLTTKKRLPKGVYDLIKYTGISMVAIHAYIYFVKN